MTAGHAALRLQAFTTLTPKQLDAVVALYRAAFEAPWEWPAAEVAGLARGDGRFWPRALMGDDAAVLGFAIAEYLPQGNFWYLHYFAVAEEQRSRGLGALMLRVLLPAGEAAAAAAGRRGCRGTLIEAEALDGPPPGADRAARARRHAFYARQGALPTGAQYPRPPAAPPAMPDWDILFIPGAGWAGPLDGAARRAMVRSMCVEGYGMAPNAPHLLAYLAQLPV